MIEYVFSQIFTFSLRQMSFTIDISCMAMCYCLRSSPDFTMNDWILYEG